jgi:putative endonuclease
MYWAYIIKSEKTGKHYIGSTQDVLKRVERHNLGKNSATKNGIPWILIHEEVFSTRQEAYRREMKFKSYKGGESFKKLVD